MTLGPIDIQKMARRKWWFFATRSAAHSWCVSTGSAGNRHLQTARAECRSVLDDLGPRICIMGPSNSGKSTLADAIARACDLPVVHLDQLHHLPGTD